MLEGLSGTGSDDGYEIHIDEEMPGLMSVSNSSVDENDFGDSGEDEDWEDESAWEDTDVDDEDDDEDLPPLERLDGTPYVPDLSTRRERPLEHRRSEPNFYGFHNGGSFSGGGPRPQPNAEDIPNALRVLERMFSTLPTDVTAGSVDIEPTLDLDRAHKLVGALEKLPRGLVERMVRVGGAPGLYEEASGDESVIAGCAICWTPLLDEPPSMEDEKAPSNSSEESLPSLLPDEGEVKQDEPKTDVDIVSLPCAHVFHGACLIPWFSRKTSCPTCRFDIDPRSLTRSRTSSTFPFPPRQPAPDGRRVFSPSSIASQLLQGIHLANPLMDSVENEELLQFTTVLEASADGVQYSFGPASASASTRQGRPRREWQLPEGPGLSLRERIEERERELGLRCLMKTCIFAPSDDSLIGEDAPIRPQVLIQIPESDQSSSCTHSVHPACLVLHTRTTGVGIAVQEDKIDVSCPLCRAAGVVSKGVWDEGAKTLELS
ncbi:hypothetical protein M422DRAFT_40301 [Sphaerobolus stellatus SS14]|nr:hypothetical protein M422DRAFT_40301 [Sphaerobolus stellatus SS14]